MHIPDTTERAPAGDPPTTLAGLKARIIRIALASGCPKRTAAAFAIGVFLSFSPFIGLQIVIGMGAAVALRLSRAAVFVGLWANLPWLIIPWYTMTTAFGAFLLRTPIPPDIGSRLTRLVEHPVYRSAFWAQVVDLIGPFVWAFLVGSTIGAAVAGMAAYIALARVLTPLHATHSGR